MQGSDAHADSSFGTELVLGCRGLSCSDNRVCSVIAGPNVTPALLVPRMIFDVRHLILGI